MTTHDRAYLYILCGIPFAGKSTLARELVRRRGFVHIDVDGIKRELGSREGPADEALWARAFDESYRRLAGLLAQGRTVVYDATNYDRAARDRARRVADAAGCPASVIWVATDVGEAERRRQLNRLAKHRYDVDDADFIEVTSGFEPPTADEMVLNYQPGEAPDTWIERAIPASRRN